MPVKSAASEVKLGELHNQVATVLSNALKVIDKKQTIYLEEGVDIDSAPEVSAPLLSVATKFLADNKITCVPEESEALTDLDNQLRQKRERREKRLSVGNVVHLTG